MTHVIAILFYCYLNRADLASQFSTTRCGTLAKRPHLSFNCFSSKEKAIIGTVSVGILRSQRDDAGQGPDVAPPWGEMLKECWQCYIHNDDNDDDDDD